MGDWGTGNFENDTAADHLSILTDRLITEVTDAMAGDAVEIEPDQYWGVALPANPEPPSLLARRVTWGRRCPGPRWSRGGRRRTWRCGRAASNDSAPSPGYKDERRTVLIRTFDELAELRRKEDSA